ncbi:carotenoid biosynthesis protein [Streptomyces sp. NBC_00365]|uniref:carotenoid biosynthesis protein n=1 Tax=Streptomyces sp. NBC_00365 TaxID=2975726 RepID=UPI0022501D55|nr:carotenoid biosynthesis protein [Streptomyces sp. NBC_00365]MCX5096550.1 carotenoid biosynthesis protein [Streptomyces sp. NBC_00365]
MNAWNRVLWLLAAAAALVGVTIPLAGTAVTLPILLLSVPFALIHGVRRYGWRTLLFFLIETLVASNFFENLSISTGFPFGHYHYTGHPQLIHVPIYIGPIYFGLGYICWQVANTLLDEADSRLGGSSESVAGRVEVVALPMLAAALMTMFDLGNDSIASTMKRIWVWERGGGVFGVPYTNYLGWWFVTYIFFQIFALYLVKRQPASVSASTSVSASVRTEGRGVLAQNVLFYGALGLSSVPYFIGASGDMVKDGASVSWSGHAINETMMTINLFGMVFAAFLALVKLARNDLALRR